MPLVASSDSIHGSPYLADGEYEYGQYLRRVKGVGWMCRVCAKVDRNKANMRLHVDVNHIDARYVCPFCQYVNKTEDARRKHVNYKHRMNMSSLSSQQIRDMTSAGRSEIQEEEQVPQEPKVVWDNYTPR